MRSLLITPILPDDDFSGSSKRCAVHLRALAELGSEPGSVDIFCLRPQRNDRQIGPALAHLVGDIFYTERRADERAWQSFRSDTSRIRRTVRAFTTLAPAEVWKLNRAERAAHTARFDTGAYDHVFGFKLAGISWARQVIKNKRTVITGDLDDISSALREASRDRTAGPLQQALDKRHVRMMRAAERDALLNLPLVMVCAEGDKDMTRQIAPGAREVAVVPNAFLIQPQIAPRAESSPVRILFVGMLNYAPNHEGLAWFIREVLPLLSKQLEPGFQIDVVGRGDDGRVARMCAPHPEMNFVGEVESIRDVYADTDLVIVPLLDGSGTRLKILEAFTLGRAVVSTTKGAEGLETTNGEHLLIGDTPEDFAHAVETAATRHALRGFLVAEGRKLVTGKYSVDAIAPQEAALIRDALAKNPA